MKRKLLAALVFVVYLVWGNYQERIKIDTNFLLDYAAYVLNYDSLTAEQRGVAIEQVAPEVVFDYYYNHPRVAPLLKFTTGQLNKFKWGFTLICTLICLGTSWLILYLLYTGSFWKRWTLILFGGVFALSLLVYGTGMLTGTLAQLYPASRKLMGAIQSPFAPALLVFLFRFGNFESYERTQPPS